MESTQQKEGSMHSVGLSDYVKMWPTPSTRNDRKPDPAAGGKRESGTPAQTHLQDAVAQRMWPTPTANEDAAGSVNGNMQPMLGNHPAVRNSGTGTLNPLWVEWLMGYPIGHTDLKPLETP
jgi:hypothetical protein